MIFLSTIFISIKVPPLKSIPKFKPLKITIKILAKKKIVENAKTYFKILDRNLNCSLIELKPITGRKHQIRKQLYSIRHCVLGDDKYHNTIYKRNIKNQLMLHSYQVRFMIDKKKYTYKALLPEHFKKVLRIKKLKFSIF